MKTKLLSMLVVLTVVVAFSQVATNSAPVIRHKKIVTPKPPDVSETDTNLWKHHPVFGRAKP